MAEIKIEKTAAVWPWVVAAILILAAAYFLFMRNNTDNGVIALHDSTNVVKIDDGAVSTFIAYADSDTTAMSLDHEFTNAALIKLADATQAIATKTGFEAKDVIANAREYAGKITNDPMVTTHADNIKRATNLLSGVLHEMQKISFPDLSMEANNVVAASKAIDTDELTLDQKPAVRAFFNTTSTLLKRMN